MGRAIACCVYNIVHRHAYIMILLAWWFGIFYFFHLTSLIVLPSLTILISG